METVSLTDLIELAKWSVAMVSLLVGIRYGQEQLKL